MTFLPRGSEEIKVEVKGTTSKICDAVQMTRNEVRLHREREWSYSGWDRVWDCVTRIKRFHHWYGRIFGIDRPLGYLRMDL